MTDQSTCDLEDDSIEDPSFTDQDYLIWSVYTSVWWGQEGENCTSDVGEAGVYGKDRALQIFTSSNPDEWTGQTSRRPVNLIVRFVDLPEFVQQRICRKIKNKKSMEGQFQSQ